MAVNMPFCTDEIKRPAGTWDKVLMKMAFDVSELSKDPNTKIGAVLISPDKSRLSVGFNGFPAGFPDRELWWNNRGEVEDEFTKYELVNHAEKNAISQAKCDLHGWSLYVTHIPCMMCAKDIVTEGITSVFYCRGDDDITMDVKCDKVKRLFKIANIKLQQIKVKDV